MLALLTNFEVENQSLCRKYYSGFDEMILLKFFPEINLSFKKSKAKNVVL